MAQPQSYGSGGGAGQQKANAAREQGQQVGREAQDQARAVADTATQVAGQVADEVAGHAGDLARDAREQVTEQARQQTSNLGDAIGHLGEQVHALAAGKPEQAGPVGDYVDRFAGQLDQTAGRVNELGFDGLVDEAQRYARRRPGAFLVGAAAAGFAVSRLARGAQQAQQHGAQASLTSSDGHTEASGSDAASARAPTVPPPPPARRPTPLPGSGEVGR